MVWNTLKFVVVVPLLLFLLAPVLMVFPISFSGDNFISWPPSSWSFKWYAALPQQTELITALVNSLILGLGVTVLSLVIGLMVAFVVVRQNFFGKDLLMGFMSLPLLLPTIVLGLSLLILFSARGWTGTWTGLIIAHLTVTLPYATRILATALEGLPADIEAASASLGASPFRVIRHVTVPLMANGVVAAAALSFLVSFDEAVISLFIVGPRLTTFPVELFRMVEERNDPLTAAASVILVLATIVIVLLVERIAGLRRVLPGAA